MLLAVLLALWGVAAHAQPIAVDVATISMSAPGVPRVVTNTLCATDGNDLVCDRGAQLLPNGVISTTGLTVNGVSITGASVGNSATTPVAFRAIKSGTQSVSCATNALVNLNEVEDSAGAFSGDTFTVPISGKYIIAGATYCSGSGLSLCETQIFKNGAQQAVVINSLSGNNGSGAVAQVMQLAAGDTIQLRSYQAGSSCSLSRGDLTFLSGALINAGSASASTALGDRITSGTTAVLANGTGYISLSTASSTWGYLGSAGSYLPQITTAQVSASTISTTAIQIFSPTTALSCSSNTAGTLRYNSPTTTLELCTGTGWRPMGVGIPAGTISAFASTTCPTGWSEYTAARGRFLRGIDNGAGNDPTGTRAPGATQADDFKSHTHNVQNTGPNNGYTGFDSDGTGTGFQPGDAWYHSGITIAATGGAETRPKNVAVTFCQFNGTSNGWNNPLSGGSTVAAGSTGQLQYNTGNAFDASAGLTWTNASSLLGVAGTVSTTSITVGGLTLQQIMASATTAQADRITSGTSAVVVNSATGIVSISQLGAVASYVHPSVGYVGPGVSATGTVSGSRVATNDVKLSGVGGSCSVAEDYGRMFRNPTTGRLQLCMPRN